MFSFKEKILVFIVFGLLTLLVALAFYDWVFGVSCKAYGEKTVREVDYSVFMGCMVKHNNKWYKQDEIKYVLKSEYNND